MNNITVLRSLVTRLEKLLEQLRSQHELKDIDNLRLKFNTLRKEYNAFARLTNYGKATVDLRVKNLKKLKAWLEAYSGEQHEEMMYEAVPKKYKKDKIIIDVSTLEKYKQYAQLAIDYLSDLTTYFAELKPRVAPILATGEVLNKKLKYFKLGLEDVPSSDDLLADDTEELPEDLAAVAPLQMIRNVGSILKTYGKFIKKVEEKTAILEPLVQELEQVDLEDLFIQLNEYNNSVKAMMITLVSMNKVIKESDFTFKLTFKERYTQLVKECLKYLPTELSSEFENKLNEFEEDLKEEQTIGRSVGKPKSYNPLRDPNMDWPKPSAPKEYSPVYPETLNPYEEEEENLNLPDPYAGKPISPEEKEKYEALWEAASAKQNQIKKLARYFKMKYNFT